MFHSTDERFLQCSRPFTEGISGFLVDEGEWEQMAVRMIQLAEDAELRIQMGCAARERAETFDVAGQLEKLEQVLLDARR